MPFPLKQLNGPSIWHGTELEENKRWSFTIPEKGLTELDQSLRKAKKSGLSLLEINTKNFELPSLSRWFPLLIEEIKSGSGFAHINNFPVQEYSVEDLEIMYWGFCTHIGEAVSQNSDTGFIHYVTDGKKRPNQGTRGVGQPGKTPLHVDLSDITSLLCVRQAPDNPLSRVASSGLIFNNILEKKPEYIEHLATGFEWDRMDEHASHETASSVYKVPLFSIADGQLSCLYNRHWMESANRRHGKPMKQYEVAMFDLVDELAHDNAFEFEFRPGHIQFCNNYAVMHGRAAHKIVDNEEQKRTLLRIWLDREKFRSFSDEAIIRFGIGYHGQLGFKAKDVLNDDHLKIRRRRSDGAIAL